MGTHKNGGGRGSNVFRHAENDEATDIEGTQGDGGIARRFR